jgi:RNA polymerase sigma-70 factor (ECF subfamily)
MPEQRENLTLLLDEARSGKREATDRLLEVVYHELRRLAGAYYRRRPRGVTLQPTAVVHEAYIRLLDQRVATWKNRAHFFGIAAQVLRRVLLDYDRKRRAKKEGGEMVRVTLDDAIKGEEGVTVDHIMLDEALKRLAQEDPRLSLVVEMRFYGGMTIEEVAEVLGVATSTIDLDWKFARAWLRKQLDPAPAS